MISSTVLNFLFLASIFATKSIHLAFNTTFIFQLSSGLKFWISRSLSTINFTATDCTLQADNHFCIFFQRTGLALNQTRRSNNLLDCWALTKLRSICLGFFMASSIADFVISWKTILLTVFSSSHKALHRCHQIASHSRSSSVAIHTVWASFVIFLSSFTTFFLSSDISYVGVKLFSISIQRSFFGRSLICQNDAFTVKSFHKNFSIVFHFAGDSTMTKFFIERVV